jgi:signal transduction histidine kinase
MRFPSLTRRWLDARQLIAGLSLVVVALALLGYWAWQASLRRHEVAIELLRSHAELAAQRLGARVQNELYVGATAVFRPVVADAALAGEPRVDPQAILEAAAAAATCNCVPVLSPAYALRTDLSSGGSEFAGTHAPASRERAAIVAALREQMERMPSGWDIAVLRGNAALAGHVLVFTRVARDASPAIYLGFATDSATFREAVLRPLLCNTRLVVAGDEARDVPNDSLVALRVTDAAGAVLYGTRARVDTTTANTTRFPTEWGELAITASLRPQAATLVLRGGVPRSPIPMLVALLGTAAALVGIATLLLWRMHELGRLRADFTSSVSHELRTPLTQILLYAETIEMGRQRSPAKHAEAIGVITRETRRLIHLVENVLHVSRAEQSLTRLDLRPRELGSLAAETIDAFMPVAESRGMRVVLRRGAAVHALVDADATRRVLLNLLDNAVRYGPAGQTVTITVDRTDAWARIMVEDQGPGVPPDRAAEIWQRFVRLDDRRAASTGCGIGLAIVSELVALQGGRRGVRARSGGGAAFFVEVPAVDDPTAPEAQVHPGPANEPAALGSGVE